MMIKKLIILGCCMVLLLTGCNYDKYADKRPFDYGDALWSCSTDKCEIWFKVDTEQDEYYYPEGQITISDDTYFCKFYFIHQTNQLSICVYPDKFSQDDVIFEISGECDFSKESFTLHIDKSNDTLFDNTMKELTFSRIEID